MPSAALKADKNQFILFSAFLSLLIMMLKNTLIQAVYAGANAMKQYFNGEFKVANKEGFNNLVTEADHAAEHAIFDVILSKFPTHGLLSEESSERKGNSPYRWIIDPIDGTVNFANGIPLCAVSIAVEYNESIIMGAVYNPFMNEFFFAQKGYGATLNRTKISVSVKDDVYSSCLVTGFPYTYLEQPNGPLEVFSRLIKKGIPMRRLGSAALDLCWVAAGRFDGFYEHQLHVWDSAAGFLIVQEAGGMVTDMEGNAYNPYQPGIIATNGHIHQQLKELIQNKQ
jgi:myo-inositol-1(or 4)-monophosphatase